MIGIMSKRTHFADSAQVSRAFPATYSQGGLTGCDKHIAGLKAQRNDNIFLTGGESRQPMKE